MSLFAGLDRGSTGHAVGIRDGKGAVVARPKVRHDAAGLADPRARLKRLAAPADLPVAIERPSGLVVETLLAAGHPVVPIRPNVVKACRPRYRAAAGKSDPGDAYMLADILRTDGHRFEGFWPGAALIFAEVDSPIALAFLARFPTPESARRLGQKRPAAFLAQHRARGRGCDHPHAVRVLARAWLRVLWRAWADRQPRTQTATPQSSSLSPQQVDTGCLTR